MNIKEKILKKFGMVRQIYKTKFWRKFDKMFQQIFKTGKLCRNFWRMFKKYLEKMRETNKSRSLKFWLNFEEVWKEE